MIPFNIIDVLTAATPIVASVATMVTNKDKPEEKENKEKQPTTININITNHFYVNSDEDAIHAANVIEKNIKVSMLQSGIRYII